MSPIQPASSRPHAMPPGSPADVGRRRSLLLQRLEESTSHVGLLAVAWSAVNLRDELPPRPTVRQLHANLMGDLARALLQRLRDTSADFGPLVPAMVQDYLALSATPAFKDLPDVLEARLLQEARTCLGQPLTLQAYQARWAAARTRQADLARLGEAHAPLLTALAAQLYCAAEEALLQLETAATGDRLVTALEQASVATAQPIGPTVRAQLRLQALTRSTPSGAPKLEGALQAALDVLPAEVSPEAAAPLVQALRQVVERAAELERVPAYAAHALHAVVRALGQRLGLADIPLQLQDPDTSEDAAVAEALAEALAAESLAEDAALAAALEREFNGPDAAPEWAPPRPPAPLRLQDALEPPDAAE